MRSGTKEHQKEEKKKRTEVSGSNACLSMGRLLLLHNCGRNVLPGPVVSHSEDSRKLHHGAEEVEAGTAEEEGRIGAVAGIAASAGTVVLVDIVAEVVLA